MEKCIAIRHPAHVPVYTNNIYLINITNDSGEKIYNTFRLILQQTKLKKHKNNTKYSACIYDDTICESPLFKDIVNRHLTFLTLHKI